jgi:hypothetical protein
MLIEPAILDRHDRRLHRRRDLIRRHRITILVEQIRDRRPRGIRDRGRRGHLAGQEIRGAAVHAVTRGARHQSERQRSGKCHSRHEYTAEQAEAQQQAHRPPDPTSRLHDRPCCGMAAPPREASRFMRLTVRSARAQQGTVR